MFRRVPIMKSILVASIITVMLLGPAGSILAFDEDPEDKGNTVEPYPVLTDGIKLRFGQIDKQYLGRRCSVYYKPGQPSGISGSGIMPEKMFVNLFPSHGGVTIENGELTGLSRHSIDVTWFFAIGGAHGGPVPDEEIDYIIVEKK